jgi:malonyl-CoA O-methyltransferase
VTAVLLDKQRVRASFAKASNSYDAMAVLQRKVGLHLFDNISITEKTEILDLGCGTGFFTQLIAKSNQDADIYALDLTLSMLDKTKSREQCKNVRLVCADAEQLPFIDNSMQLVSSNLALQWCQNLEQLFSGVHRVLGKNGSFVFSTFGVDALNELKSAWAMVDDYPHVNEFCSKFMIQSDLEKAGFIDVQIEPEDDEIAAPSEHLPERAKALGILNKTLFGNKCDGEIERIQLHYLNGKIHVDFFLPLSCLSSNTGHNDILKTLTKVVEKLPEFGDIKVYFG